jgi:hypothetical protein
LGSPWAGAHNPFRGQSKIDPAIIRGALKPRRAQTIAVLTFEPMIRQHVVKPKPAFSRFPPVHRADL